MEHCTLFIIAALALLVFLFATNCSDEGFYIPANIVGGGDFHIEPPGAIADQGSFTNDMRDYMQGQGQI